MRIVLYDILFDLTHPDHRINQHFLQQLSLLGVHHLIMDILQLPVDIDVFDVESAIKLKPLDV